MKKLIFIISFLPLIFALAPKIQNPKLIPEKPSVFEEFEKLNLEVTDPLSFHETLPEEEAISIYIPSGPLSIPENFSLITKNDDKKRYGILPFIDSREDKDSGEIEIFYGLNLFTTF